MKAFLACLCMSFAMISAAKSDERISILVESPKPLAGEIKADFDILVWNILKGKRRGWSDDLETLSEGKSLLLIQEGVDSNAFKRGLEKIEFTSKLTRSWTGRDGVATGVVTGSNIESIAEFSQRSRYLEPVIRTPKVIHFSEYKIEDNAKTLLVLNIHAINFVAAYKLKDMLKKAIDVVAAHDGPAIFAGDFNPWNGKKTRILKKLMKDNGMSEVKFTPDKRERTFGWALDYIFYKGLKLNSSKAHGKIHSSDHKPMSASFTVE